ncbi:SCO family protein [Salibaculum griseiflavum]|jgi:protein SCO1/2|uniref:SCO family protein n=1 Tax=Salibaculum griseiflavum TaxID=1914409 RepID=A0A2V1P6S5_9RHOB|nr:SCO family protein [Salibaculum griseiflavum]PWG17087.1 SCO family protein [Salibaculum griseiflavum]
MQRIIVLSVAVAAAAAAGLFFATQYGGGGADDKFAQCRATTVGGADIGGPFELVDETGRTVTDGDVITGPTIVYFGYTFCPDICPTDNMRNAMAVDLLDDRGIEVKPVFISIDPERDTPERLVDFTDTFHERMLGLTGTPEQVSAASRAYKTFFQKEDTEDEFYLVDHTTMSYLVFPEEGFVEFYRRDVGPEAMADSVACFVNAAGS